MAFSRRWYQDDLVCRVQEAWRRGAKNVLCVSPPRSGKTPMAVWLSEPFLAEGQGVFVNAHREELIRQIAMEYAEFGHNHTVLAPTDVVSDIIHRQVKAYGRSFVDQNALLMIGSVQTANARMDHIRRFATRVGLWITDEAHHVLPDNMWGKVVTMFTNAVGVGFTATPARTDRKSMSREQGGVFDALVKGVTARQLIDEGYICDYRIIAPPSSIDRTKIKVGSKGEFTQKGLVEAKHESTITGDCVQSYLDYADGQQAVVFAVDINHAHELAQAFRDAGIMSEAVSSKTSKFSRKQIMQKFERGVFRILVNVDLFGEGLNVKGIECVIMARPTQSFVLYVQQFFRALTKGKPGKIGTIIDHAGNVGYFAQMYGLPDAYNGWELNNEQRGRKSKREPDDLVEPVTTCLRCYAPYPSIKPVCPYCGHKPVPASRSDVKHVEGDLVELDAETLALMRGDIERVDGPVIIPPHLQTERGSLIEEGYKKRHRQTQEAQKMLRYNITIWAGYWRDAGNTDREIHRRFYQRFGIDIMSAQALKKKEADPLAERVDKSVKKLISVGQ